MAEEDIISFDNLTEASQHKKNAAILSRQYTDPDIQRIVDGFKKLQMEECQSIITVRVDGVLTEVGAYNREIFVFVGGLKKKVSTYYHNYIY